MVVEIPIDLVGKRDVKAPSDVLLVECQSALQLYLQEAISVDVLGDEVRPLPVVAEAYGCEAVVR